MKPTTAASGGVGSSLAYLILVIPTEWLGLMPKIPTTHFPLMLGALGVVLTALLMRIFCKPQAPTEAMKWPPSDNKDGDK